MEIRSFRPADTAAVVDLWHRCGLVVPQNDPHKDIERKLAMQPDLFLVCEEQGEIVGSVMAGYEGHRGWVNYLAVSPDFRTRGLGRDLMGAAESRLAELGCPKVNLQVGSSNEPALSFYREIGYQVDDVVSLSRRLEHDD